MRLQEVYSPPTSIETTQRFNAHYSAYSSANKKVIPVKFRNFCLAKLSGEPVVGNDKILSTDLSLNGYSRFHLIHGKVIIVYRRVGNILRLYDVIEHTGYDNGKQSATLAAWCNSLTDKNFTPLDIEQLSRDTETPKLTQSELEIVRDAIYEIIAGNGFYILKNAIEKNDWSDFFEYILPEVRGVTEEMVFITFRGEDNLKEYIIRAIKEFGKYNEYLQSQ